MWSKACPKCLVHYKSGLCRHGFLFADFIHWSKWHTLWKGVTRRKIHNDHDINSKTQRWKNCTDFSSVWALLGWPLKFGLGASGLTLGKGAHCAPPPPWLTGGCGSSHCCSMQEKPADGTKIRPLIIQCRCSLVAVQFLHETFHAWKSGRCMQVGAMHSSRWSQVLLFNFF